MINYFNLKKLSNHKRKLLVVLLPFFFLLNFFVFAQSDNTNNTIEPPGQEEITPGVDIQPLDSKLLSAPKVTDDGDYTGSSVQLHASWLAPTLPYITEQGVVIHSSLDKPAKIVEYQYSIGTSKGATDIVGWSSAGRQTEVTVTGLTLQEAQTYYFNVKAKDIKERWSKIGSSDGIIVDTTAPDSPTGLSASASDTFISVVWNANPEPDIAGYNIYRSTFSGKYYIKINSSLITEISYQDSAIVQETGYFYVVTATDKSGKESAYSNEVRVFTSRDIKPQLTKVKTWTSQSDWQEGIPFQVDTASNPGDVQLERGEFLSDEHTVALWHFNETAMDQAPGGKDVEDFSGFGNHGTAQASMTDSNWVSGKFGNALSFDGVDDYVDYPKIFSGMHNTITYEAWIYPRSFEGAREIWIVGHRAHWGGAQLLMLGDGRILWLLGSGSTDHRVYSDLSVLLDQWTHIAGTFDGYTMRLYINGEEAAAPLHEEFSVQWDSSYRGSFIGRDGSGWFSGFHGLIDEVRISNIARTDFDESRPFYSSGTLTLDFDSQQLSNFKALNLTADTPSGTSIKARVKSAYTQDALEDTTWSDYYVTFPVNLSGQDNQRWLRIELMLETTNPEVTPVVNELNLTYELADPNKQFKTWTSQSDWQEGIPFQVDTASSPGDVQLERGEFVADEHTVALWHFNETAMDQAPGGKDVEDFSGFGNHGTAQASMTDSNWVSGKFGNALSFDGVDDYVDCGNDASLQLTSDLTLEFWINPTNVGSDRINPIDKSFGGEFALTIETDGKLNYFHGQRRVEGYYVHFPALPAGTIKNKEWQYIAITRDSVNKIISSYYNGDFVNSQNYTIEPSVSTYNILVGDGYVLPFGGLIDEVRISNIARTDFDESSRAFFSSGVLTLDFDSRQLSNFKTLGLTADTPSGTNIKARVKSAYTQDALEDAVWSDYYDTFPANLSGQDNQRWIRIELVLETTDPEVTAVVKDLTIEYELSKSPLSLKTYTSQSDWQEGIPFQVDTASNPGDVQLERGEFVADEHTVALWHFNEGTGSTVADSSGSGNDGTIYGATWAEGRFGKALSFDGVDDYVVADNVPVDTTAGAKNTVEFWMKWNGQNNVMPFGWNTNYDLYLYNNAFGFNTGESNIEGISGTSFLINSWHHIAAVFPNGVPNNDNAELWIDGVKQTIVHQFGSGPSSRTVTPRVFVSGWGSDSDYKFHGLIDEVRISNIARTDLSESRPFYSSGALTLDFDTGQRSNFVRLDWTSEEIPEQTNIKVRYKTADTQEELDTALWSEYYDISVVELLNIIDERWIRIEVYLETIDSTKTPTLKNLNVWYTSFGPYLDVNRDGIVDEKDTALIESGFGLTEGSPNFNPYLDINGDGIIDEADRIAVTSAYGSMPPQATEAVYVAPGPENPRNGINASNYRDVTVEVALPETSVSSDIVTVTLSDGVTDIKVSSPALDGAGTLLISGIDTGLLLDTTIKLTAVVENKTGRSGYLAGEDAHKSVVLAQITSPLEAQVINEGTSLEIRGTALSPDFDYYILDYGKGASPTSWTEITTSTTPVDRAILSTWNVPSTQEAYYTLRLRIFEDDETVISTTVGINILSIYNVSDSPDPFSPNADSIKDTNTINATLTMPVDWSIVIKDSTEQVIKTFVGTGSTISQIWDGTNEGEVTMVPDGIYTYYINGHEPTSSVAINQQTGTIKLDATYPIATITSPQQEEIVFLDVTITGTASDANFLSYKVEYGQGTEPLTWIPIYIYTPTSPVTSGTLAFWDTIDLANGDYKIKLTVDDTAGNVSTYETAVVIDNLQITDVSAVPISFNPSEGETVHINYTINKDADVTITIQDLSYDPIKTIGPNHRLAGVNTDTWDGKNETGSIVSDDCYTFTIEASDGTHYREYTPAYIPYSVAVTDFTLGTGFDPYNNEFCQIDYNLNEYAEVLIRVGGTGTYDFNWDIVSWEPRASGFNTDYWNGRDPDGHIVSLSAVNIAIWARALPDEPIIVVSDFTLSVSTDPYSIIPSYREFTTITYTVSKPANITVSVYDPDMTLLKVLEDKVAKLAGSYELTWDGTDSSDMSVSKTGNYTIKVEAIGTDAKTKTVYANVSVY